jgi:hypothetical protein
MLEAEWWQVCGEAWVLGQRKMSQVLGAFGLLDFTMLQPVLTSCAFWNLWTLYFFNFPNFFGLQQTADMGIHCIHLSICVHRCTEIGLWIYYYHTCGVLVSGCTNTHVNCNSQCIRLLFMGMFISQTMDEGTLILTQSSTNRCLVWLLKFSM